MKNDLTCGVVRDLLPSYVEGLLGEESREAVERHLAGCADCMARKEAMASPPEAAVEAEKEMDYLKQVKRANRKRILVSVIATAVGLLAALGLKVFVIGTPLQPQSVAVVVAEVQDEGNTLFLSLSSTSSGDAFHGWRVETADGVASVYARDVLVSPLYFTGNAQVYVPLEDVREVWLGGVSGKLVWQDGVVITQECLDLLELRTPYCGDAPALGAIAQALKLQERLGGYTTELQTSRRPYRWTLEFEERLSGGQISLITACDFLFLALVGNLDEAMFTHPNPADAADPGGSALSGMTAEIADGASLPSLVEAYNAAHGTNWRAKPSIKHYADTPADFQRLMDLLESFYKVSF